jgi:hypothetical protein
VQEILFALVFIGSCLNPVIGVMALLVNHCTFVLPGLHISAGALGGVWLCDPAILGLAMNVASKALEGFSRNQRLRLVLVGWFLVCGAFHLAFPQVPRWPAKGLVFNLVVRVGMLWIVSVSVARASDRQRWLILWLTLACGTLVAVALTYTTVTNDAAFMVRYYSLPAGFSSEEVARSLDSSNWAPGKLHVPGMITCICLMAFSTSVLMLNWRQLRRGRAAFVVLSILSTFAVYGFRSKAFLVLMFLLLAVLGWLSLRRGLAQSVVSLSLLAMVAGGVLIIEMRAGHSFWELTIDRFASRQRVEERSFSGRLAENVAGLELLGEHPIFGLGTPTFSFSLPDHYRNVASGFDAHATVMLALCAGVPATVFLLTALGHFLTQIPWKRLTQIHWRLTGSVAAFLIVLAIGAVNASSIFTHQSSIVTLGIFWGLTEGWLTPLWWPACRPTARVSPHDSAAGFAAAMPSPWNVP